MHGFVLVTEYDSNRVMVFDSGGLLVHGFGSAGFAQGQFFSPQGIAISPNSDIFVADSNKKKVQVI